MSLLVAHGRSMRYECAQLARQHKAAFVQLHLPCSLVSPSWRSRYFRKSHFGIYLQQVSDLQALALERNAQRTGAGHVPQEVIQRMSERLEAPDPGRFSWEQATVTIPSELQQVSAGSKVGKQCKESVGQLAI